MTSSTRRKDVTTTTTTTTTEEGFAFSFCHSDVATILNGPMRRKQTLQHQQQSQEKDDNEDDKDSAMNVSHQQHVARSLEKQNSVPIQIDSVENLVDLALLCDDALFLDTASSKRRLEETFLYHRHHCVVRDNVSHDDLLPLLVNQVRRAEERQDEHLESLVTVATLLALNVLESTLQQVALTASNNQRRKSSGAPLLKDTLQKLNHRIEGIPSHLATICSLLLLPHNDGLNFRNLVWHGFVPSVPRPWFSLVVTLTDALNQIVVSREDTSHNESVNRTAKAEPLKAVSALIDLRAYPQFEKLLTGENLVNDAFSDQILEWVQNVTLSSGHVALCRLALEWMHPSTYTSMAPNRPATICAVLSVVLEHCLRLEWCRANRRPDDMVARPGAFYVTLDGHGQRHVHDLILHPYVLNEDRDDHESPQQRNRLIRSDGYYQPNDAGGSHSMDASTISLLMDLYCSPYGPNIRSAAAHGQWNMHFAQEWNNHKKLSSNNNTLEARKLWDMAYSIYHAMVRISYERLHEETDCTSLLRHAEQYCSVFTYVGHMRQSIRRTKQAWKRIEGIIVDMGRISMEYATVGSSSAGQACIQVDFFDDFDPREIEKRLAVKIGGNGSTSLEREHELNRLLSFSGGTMNLLDDVAAALEAYHDRLTSAVDSLGDDSGNVNRSSSRASKRKQKTALRLVSTKGPILSFLKFVHFVALSSLDDQISGTVQSEDKDEISISQEIVRRTSMTLSTVDTLIDSNLDRAIQAIKDYTASKAFKGFLCSQK
ncbi:protein of unknown function DUF4209 containing protein [Nitzschia inconspicua]|uniref:DUF4209 domain-containing protein n=1 Tax=Nitzschia inconspicua TaxID=303405 RepID=A0A9K3PGX8_9STRA|nr:protein of unknown function DUF4209 containing protein [Nitzschia inconspicua]